MAFGNRWYDNHPKISLAVGFIEKADDKLRNKIAKLIIQIAVKFEIKATKPFTFPIRRWYDKDEDLSLAMEYFRKANEQQQLNIADRIIAFVKDTAQS
ncbi:MAG TPA: hypothetical protein P5556_10215 [Candidatus Gastranaerophilales bacterium]|nr:hypothetical protein [Candidatus Gastranaerophilales bacterium]